MVEEKPGGTASRLLELRLAEHWPHLRRQRGERLPFSHTSTGAERQPRTRPEEIHSTTPKPGRSLVAIILEVLRSMPCAGLTYCSQPPTKRVKPIGDDQVVGAELGRGQVAEAEHRRVEAAAQDVEHVLDPAWPLAASPHR